MAPIVAGFVGHFLELALIDWRYLEAMYAEDGLPFAGLWGAPFSGLTAGSALILTPAIAIAAIILTFVFSIGRPSVVLPVTLMLLAIPGIFGISLILNGTAGQDVGKVWWGSAFISSPIALLAILTLQRKWGSDAEPSF